MDIPAVGPFFDGLKSDYTATIIRCFPRYEEMLWSLLAYLPNQPFGSVLDLGCGTGNLSVLTRQALPSARQCCVDLAEDSLAICRERLEGVDASGGSAHSAGALTFQSEDIRMLDFPPHHFDLVVSSIAIHHIPATDKQALFANVFRWLKPGGVFAFADQCRGETEDVYSRHIEHWRQQSKQAGGTDEEFAMWMEHQRQHDHHDTLRDQMAWLSAAGFVDVDCTWRCFLWANIQARKSV